MHLLFADESDYNREGSAPFFIYGGVFISSTQAQALSSAVDAIRVKHGYRAGERLKCTSANLPAGVSREGHTSAKRELLIAAAGLAVKFCSVVVLHELARNQDAPTLIKMGANTMLGAFDRFLGDQQDYGLAFLDRLPVPNADAYLEEKFVVGLTFPNGKSRRLSRILGVHSSHQGASNFSSVADVVLGSFRFCVNETGKDRAPREILPLVVNVMWTVDVLGQKTVRGYGLITRPMDVKDAALKKKYDDLMVRLQSFLNPLPRALPTP